RRRRDVRGPHRREGERGAALRAAGASLHRRASRIDPEAPSAAGAPARDRRPGAESVEPSRGLPLLPAVSLRHREMPRGGSAADGGGRIARERVLVRAARAGGDPYGMSAAAPPLLRAENLVKHFRVARGWRRRGGVVHAEDGVSFDLAAGETRAPG